MITLEFYIKDYVSCEDKSLYFFLSELDVFIFSYLIALVRSSSTIINRSIKSEKFCLIYDLRGKASTVSVLNMMLVMGFYI